MNVSVGSRWEGFIDAIVKEGRYGSASEVVREGLRLVEERETKLKALRETIQAALAEEEWVSGEELESVLQASAEALRRKAEA